MDRHTALEPPDASSISYNSLEPDQDTISSDIEPIRISLPSHQFSPSSEGNVREHPDEPLLRKDQNTHLTLATNNCKQDDSSTYVSRNPSPKTRTSASSLPMHQAGKREPAHTWIPEMVAMFFSLSAMITIVVLLIHANGQPLYEWQFFVSLNAIISILAAIARAPLGFAIGSCLGQAKWNWFSKKSDSLLVFERFEEASRGPLGSLWLLIWLRVRHWVVLGALLTMALLAFEPFLQAVIYFDGQMDYTNQLSPAQLAVSINAHFGSYLENAGASLAAVELPSGNTITECVFDVVPDPGMPGALFNSFYNRTSSAQSDVMFFCPTGNCTWAPFATLAVCSSCNDVTDYLTRNSSYGNENLGTLHVSGTFSMTNYTTYELPYVRLSNSDKNDGGSPAFMAAASVANPGKTLSYQNLDTLIAAIGIIRSADTYTGSPDNGSFWIETPITATECALHFCTNMYKAEVRNGVLEESLLGSWAKRDPGSFQTTGGYTGNQGALAEFDQWNNYSLWTSGLDFYRGDLQLYIAADDARAQGLGNETLKFNISQSAAVSTIYSFTDQLFERGTVTWPLPYAWSGGVFIPLIAKSLGAVQSKDYPVVFNNIATSLTAFIRDNANTTSIGQQQEWNVHIWVQWEYLILPSVTLLGGCIFIILLILETNKRGLQPWKSDFLATLAHSIDEETRTQLRTAESAGHTRNSARQMRVSLRGAGAGLELKTKKE